MLKPPAPFIRALLAFALSICSATVWAAPEPEEVEPHYYSKLYMNGKWLYFDSPQAAWDYYKPIRQAQMIKDYGPKGHPDILQEAYPAQAPYDNTLNGFPVNLAWHYLRWESLPNSIAPTYVQHWTGFIQLQAECPDKTQPITTYLHTTYTQETLTCRLPQIPHPDSCPQPTVKVGNPIYPGSGRKQQTEPDYSSPSGTGLSFSRIYRSDANGWTHSHAYAGVDLNAPAQLYPNHPPQLCYPGIGADTKLPYCFPYKRKNTPYQFLLQRPDGRLIRFGGANGMDAPADINDRLFALNDQNQQLIGWRVYNASTHAQETYDLSGRLRFSTNAQGQTTSYTYSDANTPANIAPTPGLLLTISDWQGRELKLSYDAKGRLSTLTDPAGGITSYAYDEPTAINVGSNPPASNLTSVSYPDGSKRLYHYNEQTHTANQNLPNALTGLTDENGTRLAHYKYTSGKAISTEHTGGVEKYTLSYPGGYTQSDVTNPLGSKTTYKFQTLLGVSKLTSQSQPAGSGCGPAASTLTYDPQGNLASQVDFTGSKTCYSHDLNRNLQTVRIEGLPAASACPASPAAYQSYTIPSPAPGSSITQRKITTAWHPSLRLQTKQAQPNRISTWVYHGQPDPSAGNAIASCAPDSALLPDGQPIAVLCKHIEQATTDVTGSSGFAAPLAPTIPPRVWSYTYNDKGQVLSADGPRTDNGIADKTTYTYHPATTDHVRQGDLASITNAQGHTTTYTQYDPHGRLLRSVESNGIITQNSYHPRGWLLSTTLSPAPNAEESAQSSTSTFEYTPSGQLIKATTPQGGSITYSYDPAHRLIGITDAFGNSISYTLDAMGNRLQEQTKDPNAVLAQQITRIIDALNRVQQTVGSAQ